MERVVVMAAHDSIHLREYELEVVHQQTPEEVSPYNALPTTRADNSLLTTFPYRSLQALPYWVSYKSPQALPYEFAATRSHNSLGAARPWWLRCSITALATRSAARGMRLQSGSFCRWMRRRGFTSS